MGVMWRWFEIFVANKTNIMNYYLQKYIDDDLYAPLELSDFYSGFYLLVIGWILSLIIFFVELFVHRFKLAEQKKKIQKHKRAIPKRSRSPPFPFVL